MKRLVALLLIVFTITSCSVNSDDGPDYYSTYMPVESVSMPDSMIVNNTYEVIMTYSRPNSCYLFSDIYYSHDDLSTRTIAIICSVYEGSDYNCVPLEYPEYEVPFEFHPTQTGTYIFKFWQGQDDNGDDQFLIVEVPVTE